MVSEAFNSRQKELRDADNQSEQFDGADSENR